MINLNCKIEKNTSPFPYEKITNFLEKDFYLGLEKNLLIAGLQNHLAFHDVNPVKSIDGSRNTFYLAIPCSSSVWKDVKSNEFNLKYNKNRVKLNIYQKINKFFFKYIS